MVNQGSKNMIQAFFFDLQAINSGSLRPQGIEPYKAKKAVVLGAGMMGAGIAYVLAKSGTEVVLKDISVEAAEKGKSYSEGLLDKAISRGKSTEEKKAESARPDHRDRRPGRRGRCRHRGRGGLRGPGPQGQGLRRDPAAPRARRRAVLQHLDPADHRAGRRPGEPRGREAVHRPPLLLPPWTRCRWSRSSPARRPPTRRSPRPTTSSCRSARRRSWSTTAAASTPRGSSASWSTRAWRCSRRAWRRTPSSGPPPRPATPPRCCRLSDEPEPGA
ncbi:hypothetical protein G5V59_16260 [Nocardioides sp. W3-2-3]|nr:hypothetical protein [Nocardioides convexus]